MSRQKAAREVIENRLCRDAERGRRALDRVAAVRPLRRIRIGAVDLYRRNIPACAQQPDVASLECAPVRGDKALSIEDFRNLLVHLTGGVELRNPASQSIEIDVVFVSLHASRQTMLAGRAGLPQDFQPYLSMQPFLVEDHFTNDEADNTLSIGR